MTDVLGLFEAMAEFGQPPPEECSLFTVGYGDAFSRLQRVYLERRFARGGSAEKFVIGPFGSGKTHFVRQLLELARRANCVTAEVPLTRDLDFLQGLIVYTEVTRELRTPGQPSTGLRPFIDGCLERVRQRAATGQLDPEMAVSAWIAGLDGGRFELEPFVRVCRLAFQARLQADEPVFDAACRWLSGEMRNAPIAKAVNERPITTAEERLYGRRAMLSLFQMVRETGFAGTVVGFDEAEQGLTVDKKKTARIHSLLQSEINALTNLERGSALIVYALTPDMVERMDQFMALQQRVADPGPGQGFFDGNTYASKIDLTRRSDPEGDLIAIAQHLVDVFFERVEGAPVDRRAEIWATATEVAREVARTDPTSSGRRAVVKAVCTTLVRVMDVPAMRDAPLTPEPEF